MAHESWQMVPWDFTKYDRFTTAYFDHVTEYSHLTDWTCMSQAVKLSIQAHVSQSLIVRALCDSLPMLPPYRHSEFRRFGVFQLFQKVGFLGFSAKNYKIITTKLLVICLSREGVDKLLQGCVARILWYEWKNGNFCGEIRDEILHQEIDFHHSQKIPQWKVSSFLLAKKVFDVDWLKSDRLQTFAYA